MILHLDLIAEKKRPLEQQIQAREEALEDVLDGEAQRQAERSERCEKACLVDADEAEQPDQAQGPNAPVDQPTGKKASVRVRPGTS